MSTSNTKIIKSDIPMLQWSFFQFKKPQKQSSFPSPCFLQSCTQIGSKIIVYGGCDLNGDALNHVFLFDTTTMKWSTPTDAAEFQEDHPGSRYGHSATVIEMHPPKLLVYGGMVGRTRTYEFESPDCADSPDDIDASYIQRPFMNWRKKGKRKFAGEEADDSVYFLELSANKWSWSKPIVQGGKSSRPSPRAEHSACKTSTNEITIFGGWTQEEPTNEVWIFNFVNLEWIKLHDFIGTPARPRYRHSSEVIGSKLFVLGGSDNSQDVADGARHLGIHELNLSTLEWSHPDIRGINPFPRSGHGSALIGANSIVIFGGKRSNEIFLNDTVIIDTSTYSTTVVRAIESILPTPIANCTLTSISNTLYVFGGTDAKGNCYNDIRSLDVSPYLDDSDITVSEGSRSDYSFKILIIGDASVGKSALLMRFSENIFLQNYTSTIGIDFNSRLIRVEKAVCKLEIWDTAGQERFSTITANYYRGAQGALLVYDVGLRSSFEHVKQWYDRVKQLGGSDIETVLVGNKSDLTVRQVTRQEGEGLGAALGVPYVETSALNGSNVESSFVTMTVAIKHSVDRRGLTGIRDSNLRNAADVTLATSENRNSSRLYDSCSGCI